MMITIPYHYYSHQIWVPYFWTNPLFYNSTTPRNFVGWRIMAIMATLIQNLIFTIPRLPNLHNGIFHTNLSKIRHCVRMRHNRSTGSIGRIACSLSSMPVIPRISNDLIFCRMARDTRGYPRWNLRCPSLQNIYRFWRQTNRMTCIKMANTNLLNTSMFNGSRPCIPHLSILSAALARAPSLSSKAQLWRFWKVWPEHVGYMRISQYPGPVAWFFRSWYCHHLSSCPIPMVPHCFTASMEVWALE